MINGMINGVSKYSANPFINIIRNAETGSGLHNRIETGSVRLGKVVNSSG